MSARVSHRPRPARRPARTALPEFNTLFRRRSDDTIWIVRNVYRHDRQVRLERTDMAGSNDPRAREFPFIEQLEREYEQVRL